MATFYPTLFHRAVLRTQLWSVVGLAVVGRRVAAGALFEFASGLTERPGQRRQLGPSEKHEREDQDDEKFGSAEIYRASLNTNGTTASAAPDGAGPVLARVIDR